jgi:tRNA A37 threonylcarbamoyladenosine modification protein TsaB
VNLLAVETSSSVAGVAVLRDGKITAECYLDKQADPFGGAHAHGGTSAESGEINCAELDAFAVDVGPGSFTGCGSAYAQQTAWRRRLNKPVISVDALSAMAYNFPRFSGLVTPLLTPGGTRFTLRPSTPNRANRRRWSAGSREK